MGKKYASIHIFGDHPEEAISIMQTHSNRAKQDTIEQTIIASSVIKDPAVREKIRRLVSLSVEGPLIIQSQLAVSIYDENWSFESVEKEAKSLSNKVDKPVLYASNFDEDVFIFGVFRSGKLKASSKVGQALPEYGLTHHEVVRPKTKALRI